MGIKRETKWNLENIREGLKIACEHLGRIPKVRELHLFEVIPSDSKSINRYLRTLGFDSYQQYCMSIGFKPSEGYIERKNYTYDDLCSMYDDFYNFYGFYPNSNNMVNFKSEIEYPRWNMVKKVAGNRFEEFCDKYKLGQIRNKRYEYYTDKFKEVSSALGRPLKFSELLHNQYGLPEGRWFVSHCPDKSVTNYNEFLMYLGLVPRYAITKEMAVDIILNKHKTLNRNLLISDFKNVDENQVGVGVINRHWGSFNNMLKDLGLPINQESMSARSKPVNHLVYDIIKLCNYIKSTEGRTVISRNDVKECEWCLNPQSYDRWFKKEFGYILTDFISKIGFTPVKSGMGMIHTYEDGETVSSRFEYITSNYFRENNIIYERGVKYEDFIPEYTRDKNSKDCDYVVAINGLTWYIEIAGMLDARKVNKYKDDKIRKVYKRRIKEKVGLLESNNLNYKIIYPIDFEKPLDEVFSFLWEENRESEFIGV